MINYVDGDLLEAGEVLIGHQTNCKGKMGPVIAAQIAAKYPQVNTEYRRLCLGMDFSRELLGICQLVKISDSRIVANLFGQHGTSSFRRMTEYEHLRQALQRFHDFAVEQQLACALPYNIGCNRAGGDWSIVSQMIAEIFHDYPITIYRYNP